SDFVRRSRRRCRRGPTGPPGSRAAHTRGITMAPPHALVTGAAGFIGSMLTERLLAMDVQVTGVDLFTDYYDPALKRRNLALALEHPRFKLLELDLVSADLASLPEVSVIYHLAAQPGVRASWGAEFAVYALHNVL